MAELFVFNIAERVLWKLGSMVVQEIGKTCGLTKELEMLNENFTNIKAVLLDAEEQRSKNRQLSVWLDRLNDILHQMDDILDEFEIIALQHQQQHAKNKKSIKNKVCNFFHRSNPLVFRFRIVHKMKDIREKLDKITEDKPKFHLVAAQGVVDRRDIRWERETHSYLAASSIVGRDIDRKTIVDFLIDAKDENCVSIIPIVGLGGIGKTTLAKMVFNDDGVVRHFQVRKWICVSEEFNVKKLIGSITNIADNNSTSTMEQLQVQLHETLRAKRYLLILDDVWNEDPSKWFELKDLLMVGSSGSKIVVTTRNQAVASLMGTTYTYNLAGLPFDDSVTLFNRWVFGEGKQYQNLVEIGKDIVKKCRGVPLAVKTLASLLRTKSDEYDWLLVRDNEIWNLEQRETGILPALKLSYNQLPSELKQCFSICSLFPKDYVFNHMELIYVWIAQGLIRHNSRNLGWELEDIGKRYFDDLSSRSFFEDVQRGLFTFTFKLHDLMHDLALSVTRGTSSTVTETTAGISAKVRQIEFSGDDFMKNEVPAFLLQLVNLRTITGVGRRSQKFVESCISGFKCLRILDLKHSCFEVLPSSIKDLMHLRFLDVSYNRKLKSLPNTIYKLLALQTLGLENCVSLERLPRDIGNLVSLRCLTLTTKERCFPKKGLGCLNSLRLLAILECNNLQSLFDSDNMSTQCFPALRTLVIGDCNNLLSLPKCFRFHESLENLFIGSCEKLDLNMDENEGGGLKKLQCLGIMKLPKLVTLPQWLIKGAADALKQIKVVGCINFTALPDGLTSLQKLEIIMCHQLTRLPEGMERLCALAEIQIIECPALANRCIKGTGEDWHKIAHVRNIHLNAVLLSGGTIGL
ncbi:putative disease resistance protein RGA4 [Lycium barbarum]|uniref:putative disease resistance protein RGA4 n=1 Tax=Lycium barbarum TaxID=112863 RepID=UPI00293F6254|nr:putative disease resistance protein RGA4 [Lycium barbarum]